LSFIIIAHPMSARNRDTNRDREMHARLLRQVNRAFGRHEYDEPPEEWPMHISLVPYSYALFGEPPATTPDNKPSAI
jgi:hypothetical protein